jgi:hypothetical protein
MGYRIRALVNQHHLSDIGHASPAGRHGLEDREILPLRYEARITAHREHHRVSWSRVR